MVDGRGEKWKNQRANMKNKPATRHFRATQPLIIKLVEPGEEWGWRHIDRMAFERVPE